MSADLSIRKVIWRKPDEHEIYTISSLSGNDAFIAAPFLKGGTTVSIEGRITEIKSESLQFFFEDIHLNPGRYPANTTKQHYTGNVLKAVEAIGKGQFEKVVMARQIFTEQPIRLLETFKALTKHYPSAFVYCLVLNNGNCMLGASPETLLIKEGDELFTEALGGTAQANGYGEKEYLEHKQIVIDISEKLDTLNYTYSTSDTIAKQAGNVAHLSTGFRVKSHNPDQDLKLVDHLHPTAAICGLPFKAAYDFIQAEEGFDRNYYAGYLGFRQGTDFNFYVNLRCAEIFRDGALLFAGAGINKDSDPESEWNETNEKLDTLRSRLC